MFWVPLHRLVISRAGDRALASKYCAINSSIYSMLLCIRCTIRQISRVCNRALGGIYWPLVEDILPGSGYSVPKLYSRKSQANCGLGRQVSLLRRECKNSRYVGFSTAQPNLLIPKRGKGKNIYFVISIGFGLSRNHNSSFCLQNRRHISQRQ